MACSGDIDLDNVLAPLQAASSTWRIAMGLRAGRKVLTIVGCGECNDHREKQPLPVTFHSKARSNIALPGKVGVIRELICENSFQSHTDVLDVTRPVIAGLPAARRNR